MRPIGKYTPVKSHRLYLDSFYVSILLLVTDPKTQIKLIQNFAFRPGPVQLTPWTRPPSNARPLRPFWGGYQDCLNPCCTAAGAAGITAKLRAWTHHCCVSMGYRRREYSPAWKWCYSYIFPVSDLREKVFCIVNEGRFGGGGKQTNKNGNSCLLFNLQASDPAGFWWVT